MLAGGLVASAPKIFQLVKRTESATSVARSVAAPAKAAVKMATKERWVAPKVRVAPLGNWGAKHADGKANMAARLPHIHYAKKDVRGVVKPGQGMSRHRPWQTVFKKWFR